MNCRTITVSLLTVVLSVLSSKNMSAYVGFEAGYQRYSYKTKVAEKARLFNGFYVGMSDNIKLFKAISISPGLQYSFGSRYDERVSFLGLSAKKTTQEHFIEAPLRIKLLFPLGRRSSLILYAGATFSYSISGETTYEFNRTSKEDPLLSYKYDYYNGDISSENIPDKIKELINKNLDKNKYNRFDVLLGGGGGVFFGNTLIIHIDYEVGMINRYLNNNSDSISKNNLHIGASFLF